jgi:integrase
VPPRKRRPRGHIEQLPSGSWRAWVYAGRDPLTGKDRRLKETAPTYEAAQVELTKLLRQIDEDQHPKSAITVRQAITQWLDVAELEVTTRERYDDLIRLYILPNLGDLQASKLDAGRGMSAGR